MPSSRLYGTRRVGQTVKQSESSQGKSTTSKLIVLLSGIRGLPYCRTRFNRTHDGAGPVRRVAEQRAVIAEAPFHPARGRPGLAAAQVSKIMTRPEFIVRFQSRGLRRADIARNAGASRTAATYQVSCGAGLSSP